MMQLALASLRQNSAELQWPLCLWSGHCRQQRGSVREVRACDLNDAQDKIHCKADKCSEHLLKLFVMLLFVVVAFEVLVVIEVI